jgi:molecular chaperone DnaK
VEKDSKEWSDRLPADARTRLEAALEGGREALRSGDSGNIRRGLDELNTAYSAAGASLYQAAGAGQPAGGPTDEAGAGPQAEGAPADDVVDADYEIVDEKK